MKIVIGLGNPGRRYEGTRHNVGFVVIKELARRHDANASKSQFQAEVSEVSIAGEKVLLVQPQTFMNVSGTTALQVRDFYKLNDDDLLVVCDDFALPLGRLRLRPQGSGGGQKGLANIILRLGTENVPRLRIGVGPLPTGWDAADFVLSKFAKNETAEVELATVRAADAAEQWIADGLSAAMNKYNAE
jgi:PTH1 family peptidyl-tRNA hydrolase